MEAEFYMAILTCLILGSLEGFQIVHVRKQQCLSINQNVVMSSCNASSQNQQWLSTEDGKLLHIKSGSCLGISNSSRGPFRPAVSTPCAQAPRWTCHDQEGFLEVENTSLFLKKQNRKVVVKKISKYLDSWMKLDTNKEGKLISKNLCAKQAGLGTEVSVRIARNSVAPQTLTTFHTVPYSPEHTRNTTETFLRSTAETYRPSSSKRALPSLHTTGITETAWSPSTTPPSFGTTTEVKGGGWYGCEWSQKTLSSKRLSVSKMPPCTRKSVILCLNCKLYANGFGRMRKTLKSLHLDEMELVGLGRAVPVLGTLVH